MLRNQCERVPVGEVGEKEAKLTRLSIHLLLLRFKLKIY